MKTSGKAGAAVLVLIALAGGILGGIHFSKPGIPWSEQLPLEIKNLPGSAKLNRYIQEVARTYPLDGSYPALEAAKIAKNMGFTQDIYFGDKLVAKGNEDKSSHCSGLVLEVFIKAYERVNGFPAYAKLKIDGSDDPKNFEEFRKEFYGANGNKRTVVDALPKHGLGVEFKSFDEAEPGDFVQFWRHNQTGHCAIFQQWLTNDKQERIGIQCFQTSRHTNGIAIRNEFFGSAGDMVDAGQLYLVRPVIRR